MEKLTIASMTPRKTVNGGEQMIIHFAEGKTAVLKDISQTDGLKMGDQVEIATYNTPGTMAEITSIVKVDAAAIANVPVTEAKTEKAEKAEKDEKDEKGNMSPEPPVTEKTKVTAVTEKTAGKKKYWMAETEYFGTVFISNKTLADQLAAGKEYTLTVEFNAKGNMVLSSVMPVAETTEAEEVIPEQAETEIIPPPDDADAPAESDFVPDAEQEFIPDAEPSFEADADLATGTDPDPAENPAPKEAETKAKKTDGNRREGVIVKTILSGAGSKFITVEGEKNTFVLSNETAGELTIGKGDKLLFLFETAQDNKGKTVNKITKIHLMAKAEAAPAATAATAAPKQPPKQESAKPKVVGSDGYKPTTFPEDDSNDTSDNLAMYNRFRKVPQSAQKPISGGRLNGMTDINPMYRIKALTDEFGPYGIGWKYDVTREIMIDSQGHIVDLLNVNNTLGVTLTGEISVFTDIALYYKTPDGTWSEPLPGNGGSGFVVSERNGMRQTDEAIKCARTDALGTAAKLLGVGGDVYWRTGNGSKYNT